MGKHYIIDFKSQIIQPILNGKMSIREGARCYNLPSNALVRTWLKRFEIKQDKDNALKAAIKDLKAKHPDYSYRCVHAYLPGVNHKKVQRLIQTLGLQVQSRKSKKFTPYRGTIGVITPNHLERDFRLI